MLARLRTRFAYPYDFWWYAITGACIVEEFFTRLLTRNKPCH